MISPFKIFQSACRIIIVFTIFAILTGCAGRDFTRPDRENLSLGKTTYEDIVQKYGDYYLLVTTTKNGETIKQISYSYARAAPYTTSLQARTAIFYFMNGMLIGYQYSSSFSDDKTKFDESKVTAIKRGETSKAQVIALLGNPVGYYKNPLIKEKNHIGLVYTDYETWRIPFTSKPRYIIKTLIVSCGPDEVVMSTDISSSESQ